MSGILRLLILCPALILTSSCVTRQQIEAEMWENNFHSIDDALCLPGGPLYRRGFFRRLDGGGFELISVCSKRGSEMKAFTPESVDKLMEGAFGKKK
jgi:hypothetical protein